jgi:ABC-type dipeptide/oligopeptide/nickel transport system ATPase component
MLLSVEGLQVDFALDDGGAVRAVRGSTFSVDAGATLGIVGESGSGKSATSLAILGLLPPSAVVSGRVLWRQDPAREPVDLLRPGAVETVRGSGIGIAFQETALSLDPVRTIGDQIAEAVAFHHRIAAPAARAEAVRRLAEVGIAAAERRAGDHPHQLSGGMRQRVMIALALAGDPKLLIADEPTASLDVTVQAGILDLLRRRTRERGMALVLVSHDLAVVAELADRIAVMRAGEIVEEGPADRLLTAPDHAYTRELLEASLLHA